MPSASHRIRLSSQRTSRIDSSSRGRSPTYDGSQRLTRAPPRAPRLHSIRPPFLTTFLATADSPSPVPPGRLPKPGQWSSPERDGARLPRDLDADLTGWPGGAYGVAEHVGHYPAQPNRVQRAPYRAVRRGQCYVAGPGQAFGGAGLGDDAHDVSMARAGFL